MRAYLEIVLDKFSTEDFQRSEYDYDVKQHFLGYLAYRMCQKDAYYFTLDEFDRIVEEYHSKKGFKKSQSLHEKTSDRFVLSGEAGVFLTPRFGYGWFQYCR